jgi:RimJ/RimL family protein N-acetyltransferase
VRPLVPADAEAYYALRVRALAERPPAFGRLPEEEPTAAEAIARLTRSDDRCFFGAFHGGQLVGIARLSRYAGQSEKHRAFLAGVYVEPAFRRRGCASALVREALRWAVDAGDIRRVNLTVVTQQHAAILLYESLGFRNYGTEQEAFIREGRFYHEHLMTLAIAPGGGDAATSEPRYLEAGA